MEFVEHGIRRGNFIISKNRIKELFENIDKQDKMRIYFNGKNRIYKRIENAVFCIHFWNNNFGIDVYDNEAIGDGIKEKFETEIIPKIKEFIKNATPSEEFLVKYIDGELILKRKNL